MFTRVLGPWAVHLYSASVFVNLIGCLCIYIILMGSFFNDVYTNASGNQQIPFRFLSLTFSALCGLSLLFRNLKALSYVSVIKIGVIAMVLIISTMYASPEYARRRRLHDEDSISSFSSEFPLGPTVLGFMKAMGAWQTAFLFHMCVSDMFFSMKRGSVSRWSKVSRISVLVITAVNISCALVGYLATADQLISKEGAQDLCSTSNDLFLSLYDSKGDKVKAALLAVTRGSIVLILLASFPLLFYFLKQYTLIIVNNFLSRFFPMFYAKVCSNATFIFCTFDID